MPHFDRQGWPQGSVARHGAFALRVVYNLQNKEITLELFSSPPSSPSSPFSSRIPHSPFCRQPHGSSRSPSLCRRDTRRSMCAACARVAALLSPRVWLRACNTYFVYYYMIFSPLSPFYLPLLLYIYPLALLPSRPLSLILSLSSSHPIILSLSSSHPLILSYSHILPLPLHLLS